MVESTAMRNIGDHQSLGECISPLRWLPMVICCLPLCIVLLHCRWEACGDVVVVAACIWKFVAESDEGILDVAWYEKMYLAFFLVPV